MLVDKDAILKSYQDIFEVCYLILIVLLPILITLISYYYHLYRVEKKQQKILAEFIEKHPSTIKERKKNERT